MAPARHADSEAHRRPAARSSHRDTSPDVYTNTEADNYPGAKERTRPGSDPSEKVYERVVDANGNPVSLKPVNRAFLRGPALREAHSARVEAEARARADRQSRQSSSSSGSILRTLLLATLFLPLLSSFLTGSYTFNLSPLILPRVSNWWRTTPLNPGRVHLIELTPLQLAAYDGSDASKPVYLGIGGEVFDVSKNRRVYGPGGSYHMMAGRDASRSFITGCFETHLTHDLRGLSPEQLQSLDQWIAFFRNNPKYPLVGKVVLPPIDPRSPIPPPCDGSAEHAETRAADAHGQAQAQGQGQGQRPGPVRAGQ